MPKIMIIHTEHNGAQRHDALSLDWKNKLLIA